MQLGDLFLEILHATRGVHFELSELTLQLFRRFVFSGFLLEQILQLRHLVHHRVVVEDVFAKQTLLEFAQFCRRGRCLGAHLARRRLRIEPLLMTLLERLFSLKALLLFQLGVVTRLGEPSVQVALALRSRGEIAPVADERDSIRNDVAYRI